MTSMTFHNVLPKQWQNLKIVCGHGRRHGHETDKDAIQNGSDYTKR